MLWNEATIFSLFWTRKYNSSSQRYFPMLKNSELDDPFQGYDGHKIVVAAICTSFYIVTDIIIYNLPTKLFFVVAEIK